MGIAATTICSRHGGRLLWRLAGSLVTFGLACTNRADSRLAGLPSLPAEHFEPLGGLVLEESGDVINVSPRVSPEPDGGFLIVDSREARIRIYRANGGLARQFGKRGQGPGELAAPRSGERTASNDIVIADVFRGVVMFDDTGGVMASARPPVTPIYDVLPLTATTVLVSGPLWDSTRRSVPYLVHRYNLATKKLEKSFFLEPGDSVVHAAAHTFGWVDLARRNDTVLAVFALVDSLYLFRPTGELLGALRLPIEGFRRIRAFEPRAIASPAAEAEWLAQHHFLEAVFPLADGSYIVQYERPAGTTSQWNLIGIWPDGRLRFDARDTPKLLAARNDSLFFVDPRSETPNRWLIARMRS